MVKGRPNKRFIDALNKDVNPVAVRGAEAMERVSWGQIISFGEPRDPLGEKIKSSFQMLPFYLYLALLA